MSVNCRNIHFYLDRLVVAGEPFKVSEYGTVWTHTVNGNVLIAQTNFSKRLQNHFAYMIVDPSTNTLLKRCNACSLATLKQAVILN